LVVGTGGPAGLWHFVYRSSYLDQYVASEFSPPLHTRAAQKRLFRAYQKLHASMHDGSGAGLHKMQYRRDEHHVLLSWRTSDFELYAAFDPLAEKVCTLVLHMLFPSSLRKIVSLGRAKNNVKTKHWVCLFRFQILSISSSGSTFLVCNAILCV
jgi:hypothetical protein